MDENLQQAYIGLSEHCTRIRDGKYVMSGNTISQLLKYVASQPALLGYIEKCNYGFRYAGELEEATSGGIFKLPLGSRKIVALVTGLLFEFDRGSINMHNFIKKFYRSSDIDAAFDMFANSVIMPYALAFKSVLSGESDADNAEIVDDDKAVSSTVREQVLPVIIAFTEAVAADNNLSDEAREDYFVMLEGLYYAFELARAKMVKVVWTGLNAVMRDYKGANSYIRSIRKILEQYAVI